MTDPTTDDAGHLDGYAVLTMRASDGSKRRTIDNRVWLDKTAAEDRADEVADGLEAASPLTVTIEHRTVVK